MKPVAYILLIQGIYWLVTGLWGVVDIGSFMMVTGPKTDIWLVKTVSVLIVAIAIVLLSGVKGKGEKMPVVLLAILSCAGLAGIDFYYSLNDVISDVYLADGAVQVAFLIAYALVLIKSGKEEEKA